MAVPSIVGVRCQHADCALIVPADQHAHLSIHTGRLYCTQQCYLLAERGDDTQTAELLRASFLALNAIRVQLGYDARSAAELLYAARRADSRLHAVAVLMNASPTFGRQAFRAEQASELVNEMECV